MIDAVLFLFTSPAGMLLIFAGGLLGWRLAYSFHKENESYRKRLGIE